MSDIEALVAKRLRTRRRLMGLTLVEVADKAGVSFKQVSKYETQENRITAATLWKLSLVLEVPVNYFFTEDGPL